MIFLSLGAGVQSSVMLMMAIRGEIERPDHVIFADTGWEPKHVYLQARFCEKQCAKAMIPFYIESVGNIRHDMVHARSDPDYDGRYASPPLFVDTGKAVEGRIKRQCTDEYKVAALKKKQRELLGYKPKQRIPAASAEVMIGITTDEKKRAIPSKDAWIDRIYPLIDPLKMSRIDCQRWWEENYPHIKIKKSACIGCPNRSDKEWLQMKNEQPKEFEDACDFDDAIRIAPDMIGKSYLHRSLKPLRQVDLNDSQMGLDLEDDVYCAGGCGL